jgi:hypothetical protein
MKRAIYNLSSLALIAGTILVACNTSNKNLDSDRATASDTTSTIAAPVAKTKTKLDKTQVPKEVTQLFYNDYPTATVSDDRWYGYPTVDYANDWYDYDPDLYVNDSPDTYVVEFTNDSVPHKAVYSKAGKKIAVHKMISELPKDILWAIKNGEYKTWTIAKDKEEIFKDKDSDKLKVYMVTVENNGHKHILYFQSDRRLMKDKKIS